MKLSLKLIVLCLFMTNLLFAQPGENWEKGKDRVESLKIAFITKELALTPKESQAFWPVYNQHQEKEKTRRKEMRPENMEGISEDEARAYLDEMVANIDYEANLKKEFLQQLRPILPAHKIIRLPHIEREFKAKLMKEVRDRRGGEKRPRR
jgi:hypothetical protein